MKWSPNETKFAVGSGARCISVCYFEKENDWWVSKHLKKPIRSTILSLDWHPNSVLLAAGSSDSKFRVFSAFIKGLDSKPESTGWGEKLPFNTICADYSVGGWVHDVSFSKDGSSVAFVGHDSSVNIAFPDRVVTKRTQFLPFTCVLFLDNIYVGGHDCEILQFDTNLNFVEKVKGESKQSKTVTNKFKLMDLKGQTKSTADLLSVHQNSIKTLQWIGNGISSTGLDGKLCVWNGLQ